AVRRALQDARDRAFKDRAEQALREAQERFALFMQHLPGPAFIKDGAGRLQFVNAAFAHSRRWTRARWSARRITSCGPSRRTRTSPTTAGLCRTGARSRHSSRYPATAGSIRTW